MKNVNEQVLELVKMQIGVLPPSKQPEITLASNLVDDLYLDSLDFVELAMGLEEAFEIDILDEDVEQLKTVGDIVERIKMKKDMR